MRRVGAHARQRRAHAEREREPLLAAPAAPPRSPRRARTGAGPPARGAPPAGRRPSSRGRGSGPRAARRCVGRGATRCTGRDLARRERAVHAVLQQVDEADDRVERRAQLVRHVRQELALRPVHPDAARPTGAPARAERSAMRSTCRRSCISPTITAPSAAKAARKSERRERGAARFVDDVHRPARAAGKAGFGGGRGVGAALPAVGPAHHRVGVGPDRRATPGRRARAPPPLGGSRRPTPIRRRSPRTRSPTITGSSSTTPRPDPGSAPGAEICASPLAPTRAE